MSHPTGTMKNAEGLGKPGKAVKNRPNIGEIILQRYEGILKVGFDDLERFDLIDRLEKPLLNFIFSGNKNMIFEVYGLFAEFPYAFLIRTKKGYDLWNLPERGARNAHVNISRFPKTDQIYKRTRSPNPK
jgi:hypothetical protein